MSDQSHIVSVEILNRPYKVKCPSEQAHELHQSATYVTEQMQHLQQSTQYSSIESLAIVTALNIAHDYLSLKNQQNQQIESIQQRIKVLQKRIEDSLETKDEIAL